MHVDCLVGFASSARCLGQWDWFLLGAAIDRRRERFLDRF